MAINVSDCVKSDSAALSTTAVLTSRIGVLLGVSPSAQTALEALNIRTVFDLAASAMFATAARLVAAETDPTLAEARLNGAATDAVVPVPGVPVSELSRQSLTVLKDLDQTNAAAIGAALDVQVVRDLALWPPYRVAKSILQNALSSNNNEGIDPDAPPDLLPTSGVYPTERVFYRKLLIDVVPPPQTVTALEKTSAIDLATALAAPTAFQHVATGALLTFSQSWFSQGLTLGQLLHSTSLAPGESTRIAMIDWTRQTSASTTEAIDQTEALTSTQSHNRALSEVTDATAREFQSGTSQTSVTSASGQSGLAAGIEIGPLSLGGSSGSSSSTTDAMSASSSFGSRELAAQFAQNINDRSQQNASVARNRRASIVREVSQTEHEAISTRVITNYNHMHALNVQYYEVVQAFRMTTQLERAERCLFVPLKLISFKDAVTVDRLRSTLAAAALTAEAFRQLTSEYGVVEIIPHTPKVTPGRVSVVDLGLLASPGGVLTGGGVISRTGALAGGVLAGAAAGTAGVLPPSQPAAAAQPITAVASPAASAVATIRWDRGPANDATATAAVKGWNLDQINRLGAITGRVPVRSGSDSVYVPDDAQLLGVALRDGRAAGFHVKKRDGTEISAQDTTPASFILGNPAAFADLQSIGIVNALDSDLATSLVLSVNVAGSVINLDVPVQLRSGTAVTAVQEVVTFGTPGPAAGLMDHLESNRLHYSRAVFQTLDAAAIARLLVGFTYRGLPLAQVADPEPVALTANFLVFRLNVPLRGDPEDQRFAAEQADFMRFLKNHGLDQPAPKTEVVPLPTGGVFAEAVLGRFNAAERIDLKRFWNWQDSPIPIAAPDIAPISAGSRAQAENLLPGQLGTPVLNIQSPTTLPGAAGVAPILGAIQNGNLFRDMSGLAQTTALAQAAVKASGAGATAAGDQAAKNLFTVMDEHTQRMKIAADLLGSMMGAGAAAGGAGGAQSGGGGGTVSERGGQLAAAQKIDQKAAASANSGGNGSAVDAISGADAAASPSLEKETLQNQTGGNLTQASGQVVDDATRPDSSPAAGKANPTPTPTAGGTSDPGSLPFPLPFGGAPQPALTRHFRLNINFINVAGGSLTGNRQATVHTNPLVEVASVLGQLAVGFETADSSVGLDVSVAVSPGGPRLTGSKQITFPASLFGFSVPLPGPLAQVADQPIVIEVNVNPILRQKTLLVPPDANQQPDRANLDNQLAAEHIDKNLLVGDPQFVWTLAAFVTTVKFYEPSVTIQQTM